MKHITKSQLVEILSKIKGAQPVAFTAKINARLLKKNNPYATLDVHKVSRVSAFTSIDYELSVLRQQVRENKVPDFVAKERAWGERICPALVKNNDKFYLVAKVQAARSPVYFYNDKGINKVISTDKIKPFLPIVKPTSQGLEKEVIYRNYSIDSIISISINKEKYKVI